MFTKGLLTPRTLGAQYACGPCPQICCGVRHRSRAPQRRDYDRNCAVIFRGAIGAFFCLSLQTKLRNRLSHLLISIGSASSGFTEHLPAGGRQRSSFPTLARDLPVRAHAVTTVTTRTTMAIRLVYASSRMVSDSHTRGCRRSTPRVCASLT